MEVGADFPNVRSALGSPLAKAIYSFDGVVRVFFGSDFVTVTKSDDVSCVYYRLRTREEIQISSDSQAHSLQRVQVSTLTLESNKVEGMIWNHLAMCLCIFSKEAYRGKD